MRRLLVTLLTLLTCLAVTALVLYIVYVHPCRVTRFDRLPYLAPWNADDPNLADWHAYYRSVYKQGVTGVVNLNLFSFFYYHSPLGRPVLQPVVWALTSTTPDVPWTSSKRGDPSARIAANRGFMLRRQPRPDLFHPGRMVEVFRVDVEPDTSVVGVGGARGGRRYCTGALACRGWSCTVPVDLY